MGYFLMNANFDITVRMFSKSQRNYLLMKRIILILIGWIYLWFSRDKGLLIGKCIFNAKSLYKATQRREYLSAIYLKGFESIQRIINHHFLTQYILLKISFTFLSSLKTLSF